MLRRKYGVLTFILLIAIISMPTLSACKSPPLAVFTASVLSGEAPLLVSFANTSENANQFQWDFGDGENTTTNTLEASVSHEYTQAGQHTVQLTASNSDDPATTSVMEITVSVSPGALADVSVIPESTQLDIGGTQEFTVECTDTYGNAISDFQLSWDVDGQAGSINLGVLTAGTKAGVFNDAVTATVSLGDVVVDDTASVSVNPGSLEAVSIDPLEIGAGGTRQLEISAVDEYGNQITGLSPVWSLLSEQAGSVTNDGLFAASKKAGEFYNAVEVNVKQGDVERNAKVRIVIVPGVIDQLGLAPGETNLGMEMQQQYIALAADEYGNIISGLDFMWSADGSAGTFGANGLFTSGSIPGNYRDGITVEVTREGVTLSETADVTIEPDRIVYLSNENNVSEDSYELYVMEADGTNKEQITNFGGFGVFPDADCSPDGRRIAFVAEDTIYLGSTDGTWLNPIYQHEGLWEVSWSPDGKRLVFNVVDGVDWGEIFTINVDGSDVIQLTDNTYFDQCPAWSPKGDKIAFVSTREGDDGNWSIYVMNADGTNQTRITDEDWLDVSPQWSPDGEKIIYQSNKGSLYYWGIFVMDADGSNIEPVYAPGDDFAYEPAFSPDGTRICFNLGTAANDQDIYIINLDGTGRTQLTSNTAEDILPTWLNRKGGIEVSETSINIIDTTAVYQEMTIQEVTALVRDSVVRIVTNLGSGSGFIIDSNGLILTNNHVVSEAEEITVYLEDGTEYSGEVLARDPLHDLAVVKIDATNLPALEIGEFEEVELGQRVVVLGYPLGNENVSVTSGLVSAIEYDEGTNVTYIQTDSAVNPGNSGGPMVNMKGQVIGMVAAKLVGEAIEGIGYAISISTINIYLPDLLG